MTLNDTRYIPFGDFVSLTPSSRRSRRRRFVPSGRPSSNMTRCVSVSPTTRVSPTPVARMMMTMITRLTGMTRRCLPKSLGRDRDKEMKPVFLKVARFLSKSCISSCWVRNHSSHNDSLHRKHPQVRDYRARHPAQPRDRCDAPIRRLEIHHIISLLTTLVYSPHLSHLHALYIMTIGPVHSWPSHPRPHRLRPQAG